MQEGYTCKRVNIGCKVTPQCMITYKANVSPRGDQSPQSSKIYQKNLSQTVLLNQYVQVLPCRSATESCIEANGIQMYIYFLCGLTVTLNGEDDDIVSCPALNHGKTANPRVAKNAAAAQPFLALQKRRLTKPLKFTRD